MQRASLIPNLVPVIMAGGAGTRLWPLSRKLYPKQFQAIHPDGHTPFQAALRLAERLAERQQIQVVTACEQRFLAARQAGTSLANPLWTEPCRRGTAAVAALAANLADKADDLVLLMPADQYIADTEGAIAAFQTGAKLANQGRLVLFGVQPTAPETGFGYIEVADRQVEAGREVRNFHEKPDAETAAIFQQSGRHLWNSGLFMVQAKVLLDELRHLAPEVLTAADKARADAQVDGVFSHLPQQQWEQVPEASFDRAVAEKSSLLTVVDFDVGWSDLGAFDSLWQSGTSDENGNVAIGDVMTLDTDGSFLHAHEGRLLAVMGMHDLTVVDSGDAILVAPRSQSQKMRRMVAEIADRKDTLLDNHAKVFRPWGSYIQLDQGPTHLCKRIVVDAGHSLSLQRHRHRSEHWVVVRGQAEVRVGDEMRRLEANESVYIPQGTIHSLHNPGDEELEIIEVQTGQTLSEDDIERLEDNYGRKT